MTTGSVIAMKAKMTVVALNADANIYAVLDEQGNSIGTGSREVCEALADIATGNSRANSNKSQSPSASSQNIRSAITI